MKTKEAFKEKIRRYIEENHLNPTSFSKMANIPSSIIHNIINSHSPNPTIDTAIKVAASLNCSLDELFEDKKKSNNEALDLFLIKSICNFICELEELKGITFDAFYDVLSQIYTYCKENKLKKVDQTYAQWYVKKVYNHGIL